MKLFSHQAAAYQELLSRAQTFFAGHWKCLPIRCRWHSLVVGPTGSGKTALASILAEETGAALLRVSVTGWIPAGANNRAVAETLEVIVGHVNAHSRSILVLDEVDKIYHDTPWMGYIRGELFELCDGLFSTGTKVPTLGEDEGLVQISDETSLNEKLRSSVFIVGAGAFQDFYETRSARPIGFNPSPFVQAVGPTSEYIVQKLPRELKNRFNSQLLLLPELAPGHYKIIASEAEKSLPEWIVPEFRRAAAQRMEQAIAAKSGCRFVEEALMDALQLSKPPPQPQAEPTSFPESAEDSELECEL